MSTVFQRQAKLLKNIGQHAYNVTSRRPHLAKQAFVHTRKGRERERKKVENAFQHAVIDIFCSNALCIKFLYLPPSTRGKENQYTTNYSAFIYALFLFSAVFMLHVKYKMTSI
jgi:hypothetical protein